MLCCATVKQIALYGGEGRDERGREGERRMTGDKKRTEGRRKQERERWRVTYVEQVGETRGQKVTH